LEKEQGELARPKVLPHGKEGNVGRIGENATSLTSKGACALSFKGGLAPQGVSEKKWEYYREGVSTLNKTRSRVFRHCLRKERKIPGERRHLVYTYPCGKTSLLWEERVLGLRREREQSTGGGQIKGGKDVNRGGKNQKGRKEVQVLYLLFSIGLSKRNSILK